MANTYPLSQFHAELVAIPALQYAQEETLHTDLSDQLEAVRRTPGETRKPLIIERDAFETILSAARTQIIEPLSRPHGHVSPTDAMRLAAARGLMRTYEEMQQH